MKKRLYISPKAKFHYLRIDRSFLAGSETLTGVGTRQIPGESEDGSDGGCGNGRGVFDY